MSDPLSTSLSQLTPDTSRLDRDALLYAAGGASIRPNGFWKGLSGGLALTQAAMLFYFCTGVPMISKPVIPASEPSTIATIQQGPEKLKSIGRDHSIQKWAFQSLEWIDNPSLQNETIEGYSPPQRFGGLVASDPSLIQ